MFVFVTENKEAMSQVVKEISNKGVVPAMYWAAIAEFAVFWYFAATMLTSTLALVYYRKF